MALEQTPVYPGLGVGSHTSAVRSSNPPVGHPFPLSYSSTNPKHAYMNENGSLPRLVLYQHTHTHTRTHTHTHTHTHAHTHTHTHTHTPQQNDEVVERSRFARVGGRWFYMDSSFVEEGGVKAEGGAGAGAAAGAAAAKKEEKKGLFGLF